MSYKKELTKKDAFLLFIVGLILGTVFCIGNQFWYNPAISEKAIHATATYLKYDIYYSNLKPRPRGQGKFYVYFEDYESLLVYAWNLYDDKSEFIDKFKNLPAGTEVDIIVHPNSGTLLDMRSDEFTLVEFDESIVILSYKNKGFFVLGIIMYFFSFLGLFCFIYLNYKSHIRIKKKKKII